MDREQAERLRMDEKHWTLGVIYSCNNDPRVIVRNRWFLGWTWNFGNPYVFIVLPIFVAIFLVSIFFIAPLISGSLIGLIIICIVTTLILVGIAHYIAQGPR